VCISTDNFCFILYKHNCLHFFLTPNLSIVLLLQNAHQIIYKCGNKMETRFGNQLWPCHGANKRLSYNRYQKRINLPFDSCRNIVNPLTIQQGNNCTLWSFRLKNPRNKQRLGENVGTCEDGMLVYMVGVHVFEPTKKKLPFLCQSVYMYKLNPWFSPRYLHDHILCFGQTPDNLETHKDYSPT
jgi:hypothetical protein